MSIKQAIINFLDPATYAHMDIDYAHHEIHEGNHYFIKSYTTLNNGADIDFCVTTPDTTKWSHMTFIVQGTAITTMEIYESVTFSDAGASITAYNNNRNSSNTSSLTVASERGISVAGNKIWEAKGGTATNPQNRNGLIFREDDEMILKQNASYVFRLISSTDGNIIDYKASWYEHTNKS